VARLHRVGHPSRREGRRVPRARPPADLGLDAVAELTHFACTSEDINSAYALTVKRAVENVWLPKLRAVIDALAALAHEHRDAAMLSRTHGQPATPSTMGKELAVFAWRLERVAAQIAGGEYLAKFSGATGTWSAHLAAAPDVDWPELSRAFIEGLGIDFNVLTTQIESHDWQVELYDRVRHAGGILHNLATDIWTYISMGFFAQIPVAGATGSSTMPHKINPIRFENAEANLEISGGLFTTLASTLVTSRMQRDLTDSTTQRNIGVAFGHSLLALDNLQRGLTEISLSRDVLLADLDANWEVLAEAIQTVVRAEIVAGRSQITDPYALLKELTRGRRVGGPELAEFVRTSTSARTPRSACWRSRRPATPASRTSSSTGSERASRRAQRRGAAPSSVASGMPRHPCRP
jgi:adenylosuccinate lyase